MQTFCVLVSTENTRSVLSEAQAWINSVVTQDDNNNRELTYKQFVDLVGDSIGQKGNFLDLIQ